MPRRNRVITAVLATLATALALPGALGADAAAAAEPLTVVRAGDAVVGYTAGLPEASVGVAAASDGGFAVFDGITGNRGSFSVRFLTSTGVDGVRDELSRAFGDLDDFGNFAWNLLTGTVAGSLSFTNPGTGVIEVVVADTSPCGALGFPGVVGCGGPIVNGAGVVTAGKVWITADYLEMSQAAVDVLVRHELGHALGLAHFAETFEGRRQVMYPSVSTDATVPGYRSGDRNGLAFLSPPLVPIPTTTSTTAPPTTVPPTTAPPTTAPPTTATPPTTTPPTGDAAFTPLTPTRILDTRSGVGSSPARLGGGQVRTVTVAGRGGVPASGASAVVLNLTAVGATEPTFVTAYPTGTALPLASNLNPIPGEVAANLVVVRLGTGGAVDLYNRAGSVDLVADVAGWFASSSSDFTPVAPSRLLDTRVGTGAATARVGAGSTATFTVTGRGGVPSTGVAAVVLNVTAVGATLPTFVTALPTGTGLPTASNLNPSPGRVTANLVVVPVGSLGRVSLFNAAGSIDLVADVAGWFAAPVGEVVPVTPARVLDTRSGNGAPAARVGAAGSVTVQVTGRGGVPSTGVTAVLVNVTGVGATLPTFLTAFAAGSSRPTASNLNPVPGLVASNLAVVPLSANGRITIYNNSGSIDLVADVAGYVLG